MILEGTGDIASISDKSGENPDDSWITSSYLFQSHVSMFMMILFTEHIETVIIGANANWIIGLIIMLVLETHSSRQDRVCKPLRQSTHNMDCYQLSYWSQTRPRSQRSSSHWCLQPLQLDQGSRSRRTLGLHLCKVHLVDPDAPAVVWRCKMLLGGWGQEEEQSPMPLQLFLQCPCCLSLDHRMD